MLNTFQTQETGNQTETVKLKTRSLHFNLNKNNYMDDEKRILLMLLVNTHSTK